MGHTPQATAGWLDRVGQNATRSPRSSFSCGVHVYRCWVDHLTRRIFARRTTGLHLRHRFVAQKKIKHVSHTLALELSETCGKIDICSRDSSSDDEAVYIRLGLNEVLFGQLDFNYWQAEAGHIPAALVVDCRGVYDALALSSSSCHGLKDKKYGLEALAFKVLLSVARWCAGVILPHSWVTL